MRPSGAMAPIVGVEEHKVGGNIIKVMLTANDILDTSFAREAVIQLCRKVDWAGGPTGTLEDQFATSLAVSITVDGQSTAPSHPLVWNVAGYAPSTRPARQVTIVADFMLANASPSDSSPIGRHTAEAL